MGSLPKWHGARYRTYRWYDIFAAPLLQRDAGAPASILAAVRSDADESQLPI